MRRLFVTGANGYIGRRLVETARRAGLEVVEGMREPAGRHAVGFDLRRGEDLDEVLRGVDAVVHLAAILDDGLPRGDQDPNVAGTRRLLEAARRQQVRRFVFISSQSAASDAASGYGEQKWRIEQLLDAKGEVSVRLGLISGGAPRGVYGQLLRMLRKWPVFPVLRPGAPVYPVHVDDLCRALVSFAVSGEDLPRLFWVGPRESLRFADYLRLLARERLGRRVVLLPVPVTPVLVLLRLVSFVPFLPKLPEERIRGLAALSPMEPELRLEVDGLREADRIFTDEGRRRRLVAEGRTLCAYVLGWRPVASTVRRYVRAVLAEDDSRPLELPVPVQAWPRLMRLFEPLSTRGRLQRRFEIATRVVEMTIEAAPRFHLYESRPRWLSFLEMAWMVGTEALLLPVRAALGRFGKW